MSATPPIVLIVDDDLTLPDMLAYALQQEGFRVLIALDGTLAVRLACSEHPDLIMLDLSVAGPDGVEIFQAIRREHQMPILILSSGEEAGAQIQGLDLGTKSYLAKPYQLRELLDRVRALLRQMNTAGGTGRGPAPPPVRNGAPAGSATLLHVGPLTIDLAGRTVQRGGQRVALKPKEFDLLSFLARHPDQTFTREMLLDHVWGSGYVGSPRTVDVHVRCLRAKLEPGQNQPSLIQTVFSVGYKLVPPPGGPGRAPASPVVTGPGVAQDNTGDRLPVRAGA